MQAFAIDQKIEREREQQHADEQVRGHAVAEVQRTGNQPGRIAPQRFEPPFQGAVECGVAGKPLAQAGGRARQVVVELVQLVNEWRDRERAHTTHDQQHRDQ